MQVYQLCFAASKIHIYIHLLRAMGWYFVSTDKMMLMIIKADG